MTTVAEHPPTASHSVIALIADKMVRLCAVIPYALVALLLRFVMARVFFVAGQAKIEGSVIPINTGIRGLDFSIVLPAQIKDTAFQTFQTQYAALPIPPNIATYLFTYAEFALPVCLIIGFATRISATALLAMTLLIQIYVMPDALWTAHIYWIAILMTLMSVGPGAISFDALIRYIYER